jgi:hypothetical protein
MPPSTVDNCGSFTSTTTLLYGANIKKWPVPRVPYSWPGYCSAQSSEPRYIRDNPASNLGLATDTILRFSWFFSVKQTTAAPFPVPSCSSLYFPFHFTLHKCSWNGVVNKCIIGLRVLQAGYDNKHRSSHTPVKTWQGKISYKGSIADDMRRRLTNQGQYWNIIVAWLPTLLRANYAAAQGQTETCCEGGSVAVRVPSEHGVKTTAPPERWAQHGNKPSPTGTTRKQAVTYRHNTETIRHLPAQHGNNPSPTGTTRKQAGTYQHNTETRRHLPAQQGNKGSPSGRGG